MVYSALVNTALVAVLSYRFRFYGFMAAMCLSFLFNFVYLCRCEPFSFRLTLKFGDLGALIRYGLPFMMLMFLGTLFETMDRIMISKFIGLEVLGLYSIAVMTSTYIYSVPNAISVVLVPNLHEIYGKNDDARDLRGYLFKSDLVFTTMVPLFTGLAWFVMPSVVRLLLPEFAGGIEAMRFLVLGVFFLAVGQAYLQFIYVVKKELSLIPVSFAALGLAALLTWAAIYNGWGLVGVAIATVLAIFLHYLILYWYAARQVLSGGECWRHFAGTLGKFVWMCALLFSVERWIRVPSAPMTALLQVSIFTAAYAPFLAQLERRFNAIGILKARFSKRAAMA
jgi:O-antigen/teichoic acid export membrane protein